MVTFRQFEAFLMIAELGSFTRAARHLHISQPGLSLMIREFEAHFGKRLFDRSSRSVLLTESGQDLLPSARRIVDEFQTATSRLRDADSAKAQRLSVASTPLFSSALMPAVYQRFRDRNPQVELRLAVMSRDEVGDAVRRGDHDCGVGIFSGKALDLQRDPLFHFGFILLTPSTSSYRRETQPRWVSWESIPKAPYVELPWDSGIQQVINRRKADAGVPGQPPAQVMDHLETIIGMTAAGAGPSILPSFVLAACGGFNVRVSRIRDVQPSALAFHAVTARGRGKHPLLPSFLEALRSLVAEQPWASWWESVQAASTGARR
ncbi:MULTISPECIES: LysR family transcriptional regulator [Ramlibacter]|uniref:LysR family transcriptional regulator n=1 Tax=Ramlibacter pinisoli TaxID=2682844 RepID=A0A6N8IQY2_9BURK|nr:MULTISPECIES: LysR family transcriptional regulator [Ramlibacter]MBA2964258.1 LysR family transcriptional regulator [Ramlibacter sp. CGMCC 1.13660]MVQ29224.1 LysR family transcriptional regulator [Ramlibacter pinisoli]